MPGVFLGRVICECRMGWYDGRVRLVGEIGWYSVRDDRRVCWESMIVVY